MEQYNVTGMSCAACQTRVEKAVSKVPGVTSCAVSLLTNSMGVEGTASPAEIIAAVENAGYGASKKGEKGSTSQSASTAEYEEMLKELSPELCAILDRIEEAWYLMKETELQATYMQGISDGMDMQKEKLRRVC